MQVGGRAGRRALAAFSAALALGSAGCGFGPGEGGRSAELTVTRDYGAKVLVEKGFDDLTESDTVMRVLDGEVELETRYGGGFVQSIDGLAGETSDGRSFDWFYFANGVEADVGAADYEVEDGSSIWWDYRDWTAAQRVPAVVGSFPEPMLHGYEGQRWPVELVCMGGGAACDSAQRRLEEAGVKVEEAPDDEAIRVLVGPWQAVSSDPAAAGLEKGPAASGVFARFEGSGGRDRLVGLDEDARPAHDFGPAAGLIAATREGTLPPTWIVTGGTPAAVGAAAGALAEPNLRNRYAAVIFGARVSSLPVR